MEENEKYLNAYRANTLTGLLEALNQANITKEDIVAIYYGAGEHIAVIQK
jgi:hypothetical protein|nr:MAG TPA: TAL effector repeat protein [Crassvirales sp.]